MADSDAIAAAPTDLTEIRSTSVLPAIREEIELHTADGLTLVGELALPESGHVSATLVTMHPLPTHGGFMDSHVFRKAAWRLPHLADVAVLRFNTRGTSSPRGRSEGEFDEGVGEAHDLRAAVAFVQERGLPHVWLVGWSFGTEVTLMHGADQEVDGGNADARDGDAEHRENCDNEKGQGNDENDQGGRCQAHGDLLMWFCFSVRLAVSPE